jgi:uncharacterized protein YpmS
MNTLLTLLLAFNVNTAPVVETLTTPVIWVAETEEIVPISEPIETPVQTTLTEEQLDKIIADKLEELLDGGLSLVVE